MTVENIAEIVHEANRAYCKTLGDLSQPAWDDAPDWQKDSARKGAEGILTGAIQTPEQSHESWLAEKEATGWRFGTVKNPETKEHPCFVPYSALPPSQRAKDAIYFAIVTACRPLCDSYGVPA